MNKPDCLIIGAAILDIPLIPVPSEVLSAPYTALERIAMHIGGDAANEARVLARLGHRPALISVVGEDVAGEYIRNTLSGEGVDVAGVSRRRDMDTGINVVLVRPDGERSFITGKSGSLRRLSLQDIDLDRPEYDEARIACLASMFVSSDLDLPDTERLFDRIKARGMTLCADTTRRKREETLAQAAPALSKLDYFFPNYEEAALLTGADSPEAAVDALIGAGVGHVALKLGGRGCLLSEGDARHYLPAVTGVHCVDTTGAGDTFAAAFMAALMEGRSFVECGRFANAAASLCVESVGAFGGGWTRGEVEMRAKS